MHIEKAKGYISSYNLYLSYHSSPKHSSEAKYILVQKTLKKIKMAMSVEGY